MELPKFMSIGEHDKKYLKDLASVIRLIERVEPSQRKEILSKFISSLGEVDRRLFNTFASLYMVGNENVSKGNDSIPVLVEGEPVPYGELGLTPLYDVIKDELENVEHVNLKEGLDIYFDKWQIGSQPVVCRLGEIIIERDYSREPGFGGFMRRDEPLVSFKDIETQLLKGSEEGWYIQMEDVPKNNIIYRRDLGFTNLDGSGGRMWPIFEQVEVRENPSLETKFAQRMQYDPELMEDLMDIANGLCLRKEKF